MAQCHFVTVWTHTRRDPRPWTPSYRLCDKRAPCPASKDGEMRKCDATLQIAYPYFEKPTPESPPACLAAARKTKRVETTVRRGGREKGERKKYSVMPKFSDPPLMWIERAATCLFGVKQYGVHLNGYTVSSSGEVSMWLARRSPTKQTYPGLLDNVAAGGLSAGFSIKQTLVKECQEEACIPAAIAEKACPVTTVSYTYEDEEGVYAETQFVFDLELPLDFKPIIGDKEVQEFYLLSMDKVKDLLATEDFKPNCAMVVLDFLIRHSFIEPDTVPCYQEFVAGLHQTLE
ncbi:thiamine pyrophosphokinase 2 isoform X2 [Sparus aurata]|uniref:thiamine pyrophosphokinase 2 isoform X2 n=1 Tax=Sparus aurata TaxID=8175 RepID=UPI0011C1B4B3|nr:nudix hydrolase 20, chloroplastic-like isoform X2 [Sparus aurata]